jgi:carbonic anhydrase
MHIAPTVYEASAAMNSKHTIFIRSTLSAILLLLGSGAFAADKAADHTAAPPVLPAKKLIPEIPPVATAKEMGDKVRDALGTTANPNKKLTLVINGKPVATAAAASHGAATPAASHSTAKARAAAKKTPAADSGHGGEVHWSYQGEGGPQAWGKLKPEFNLCALGTRQSPINIQDGGTLMGPAEPIQFSYTPSNGTVVNNGHTIQVDVAGENSITVRGTSYRLAQFHFHTPSEEQVNGKRFAMVAHLVHKSDMGQLAVVAVLMEVGGVNTLIDKVWTYMPLDTGDKVNMPRDMLDLNELLPADQRYYQFMGSLTTPPCTEGVLWMVLKEPVKISKLQYRLFSQLYPNNARPVQPVNGRPVRDGI